MSENTENAKINFALRIRNGVCVLCDKKDPVTDLKIQNIEMPSKQEGGFFFHNKCLPMVTVDFAKAMMNCKTLDDINNMLNS